ncbi:MAG: hypothetical protein QXN68_03990 [Thermoplasmata archaeon]
MYQRFERYTSQVVEYQGFQIMLYPIKLNYGVIRETYIIVLAYKHIVILEYNNSVMPISCKYQNITI